MRNRTVAAVVWAVIAILVLGATTAGFAGGLFGRGKKDKAEDTSGADLAVAELRVHEVRTSGAEPRVVIQAVIENQKPVGRTGPYELQVRQKGSRKVLGACRGEALPQGQSALCELWLKDVPIKQGDTFEAMLNRGVADFGSWDQDESNDRRTAEIRTISEGGEMLRLVSFEIVPTTIRGTSDVQFRFQIEGAHLVWLLAEDRPPRLLAGHPADGLLQGKGRERISASGPVTLVARNSFGSFVYKTIPVINAYQEPAPEWTRVLPQEVDGVATMKVLDPGVYDIDADAEILQGLRTYLATKEWLAPLDRLREHQAPSDVPQPASVLNPRARTDPPENADEERR